ncbi:hypothetical protein GGS23DRAFT_468982 [Durotheca rogersii]|uniref:uncharacterized protein n=1 Tax=Durotheca rogersii TaxID=419775 RepID=UPI00221EE4F7|nr:uncharacterized protein GGS23DRAFT_468982 [Durotheca rogersii]KAI5864925.1 hypothetical protein GGS23DRAFT_468982 [Durotheca rogersii]
MPRWNSSLADRHRGARTRHGDWLATQVLRLQRRRRSAQNSGVQPDTSRIYPPCNRMSGETSQVVVSLLLSLPFPSLLFPRCSHGTSYTNLSVGRSVYNNAYLPTCLVIHHSLSLSVTDEIDTVTARNNNPVEQMAPEPKPIEMKSLAASQDNQSPAPADYDEKRPPPPPKAETKVSRRESEANSYGNLIDSPLFLFADYLMIPVLPSVNRH